MGKNKGEMKYHTLKESLKNDILSGVYQPGDKMPSENQLVQEYDLSRHTVRKALSILEEEGYIIAVHGKGTFCTERALHKKESKNIAVVTTYISDYIFPRLIQGINVSFPKMDTALFLRQQKIADEERQHVLKIFLQKILMA